MGRLACGKLETYADDVERIRLTDPSLAEAIASFTGVIQVVDWFTSRSSRKPAIDLVNMDEFEYDFVIELEPEGRWIAFGVT